MNCVLGSFYLFTAVGGIFEAAYGYQKTLTLTLIGLFLTYHVPSGLWVVSLIAFVIRVFNQSW